MCVKNIKPLPKSPNSKRALKFTLVQINHENYNQEFIDDIETAMEEYKKDDYLIIDNPINVWKSI